jgi:hypothetical protein
MKAAGSFWFECECNNGERFAFGMTSSADNCGMASSADNCGGMTYFLRNYEEAYFARFEERPREQRAT